MEEKMRLIYDEAIDFLDELTEEKLSNEQLKEYFEIDKNFQSKEEILYRLLASLQNTQMMPNVIGFEKEERKDRFKRILCDFKCDEILNKYDEEKLYEEFKNNFEINNVESPRNLWRRYTKSIISACNFLNEFESAEKFDEYVNSFKNNEYELPMILSNKIYGIGFALCCDFLKELGYSGYAKPDVHIKDIFTALDLCSSDDDYIVFQAVVKMAKVVNDTPYNVDKIFWLISSGNLYKHNINIGRHKDEFINRVNKLL